MKKKIFLLVIMILLVLITPVFAKEDGFYAGDELSLKDPMNRTAFVAGNNIEMSSTIDGLSFVAGNNLSLSSTQDYLFAAGNNLNLEGVSTKDAFIAGSTITIKESTIRDLYAAGQRVRIDSHITRNAYIGGDKVTINSIIDGDVRIAADEIRIGKEAVINGTLTYPEKADVSISETASIYKTKTYAGKDIKIEATLKDTIISIIVSFLSLLLIESILFLVNKRLFKNIIEEEKSASYIFKTSFIGFIFLILLPVAAILSIFTMIGIPLSIISLLIYGIFIYLSIIPSSYYIGTWLLKDKIKNEYLILVISLLGIYLLKLLPIVGGLISFLSLILGLGLYMNSMKSSYLENKK